MSRDVQKAALIGTGGIARAHAEAVRALGDQIKLMGAMDVHQARVTEFCDEQGIPHAYTDVARMLTVEEPDVVLIATPPGTHAELCIQSMEAGAWVLCEKPLCASLAEMDAIEEAERRTGQYTSSVFQWRFGSGGQHLKRLIQQGVLGRPLVCNCLVTWYRAPAYYAVPWRGKWATELGGTSMGHGIHAMDFVLWLLGEWQEVRATIGTLDRAIEVEDVSMASVRFANGALANMTNSAVSPREASYVRFDFQLATVELTHLYSYRNADWRYAGRDRGGCSVVAHGAAACVSGEQGRGGTPCGERAGCARHAGVFGEPLQVGDDRTAGAPRVNYAGRSLLSPHVRPRRPVLAASVGRNARYGAEVAAEWAALM